MYRLKKFKFREPIKIGIKLVPVKFTYNALWLLGPEYFTKFYKEKNLSYIHELAYPYYPGFDSVIKQYLEVSVQW